MYVPFFVICSSSPFTSVSSLILFLFYSSCSISSSSYMDCSSTSSSSSFSSPSSSFSSILRRPSLLVLFAYFPFISLIHSFTHSLIHSFTHSLIHSFTHYTPLTMSLNLNQKFKIILTRSLHGVQLTGANPQSS